MELLISFGCSVEDSGDAGTPPLVAACSTNQLEVVQKLFNLGANLDSHDVDGNTALHICAATENPSQVIRFLLMNGADTKIMNMKGITAITVNSNCQLRPCITTSSLVICESCIHRKPFV